MAIITVFMTIFIQFRWTCVQHDYKIANMKFMLREACNHGLNVGVCHV
jgi:hypothetical protein